MQDLAFSVCRPLSFLSFPCPSFLLCSWPAYIIRTSFMVRKWGRRKVAKGPQKKKKKKERDLAHWAQATNFVGANTTRVIIPDPGRGRSHVLCRSPQTSQITLLRNNNLRHRPNRPHPPLPPIPHRARKSFSQTIPTINPIRPHAKYPHRCPRWRQ